MKRNGGDRVTVKYHKVYPLGVSADWLSPLCLLAWMESTNLGTVPCGHYDVGVDGGSIVNVFRCFVWGDERDCHKQSTIFDIVMIILAPHSSI